MTRGGRSQPSGCLELRVVRGTETSDLYKIALESFSFTHITPKEVRTGSQPDFAEKPSVLHPGLVPLVMSLNASGCA